MCVTVYACMCELECMTFCDCLYNCMHCALNLCVCVFSLGLLSSIPSHTPSANSVCPIYLTTPNSAPVTNTFIPVSKVTLVMEERERGEVVREGVCEEVDEVRGCLARGTLLWYTAKDDVIMTSL